MNYHIVGIYKRKPFAKANHELQTTSLPQTTRQLIAGNDSKFQLVVNMLIVMKEFIVSLNMAEYDE